ncbi:pyocin S6 family toxin immunity protein [Pseudomonas sp. ZS1P83]
MYLRITGFFPEPDDDDSLQYKRVIQKDLEPSVFEVMGWSSLEDGLGGQSELTSEQVKRMAEVLGEPAIERLSLFIGSHS